MIRLFNNINISKNRIIEVIQAWFQVLNYTKKLIIITIIEMIMFNIRDLILHNTLNIFIEIDEISWKMNYKKKLKWINRCYLIINEINMINYSLIAKFHHKLCLIKNMKNEIKFNELNIIFLSDFLQLSSISFYYLYNNKLIYQ